MICNKISMQNQSSERLVFGIIFCIILALSYQILSCIAHFFFWLPVFHNVPLFSLPTLSTCMAMSLAIIKPLYSLCFCFIIICIFSFLPTDIHFLTIITYCIVAVSSYFSRCFLVWRMCFLTLLNCSSKDWLVWLSSQTWSHELFLSAHISFVLFFVHLLFLCESCYFLMISICLQSKHLHWMISIASIFI